MNHRLIEKATRTAITVGVLLLATSVAAESHEAHGTHDAQGVTPPAVPVGGAQAMAIGQSNFVELELTPGQYVALCFVPDPATGQPHLVLGMITSFAVRD